VATDYADLPAAEQQVAASVKEMVETHNLNQVLSSAVNAAFDSKSTDPVAFMGNFLVERIDRPPQIHQLSADVILGPDMQPCLEVEVSCSVNGVPKVFGKSTAPALPQFEPPPAPGEDGEEAAEGEASQSSSTGLDEIAAQINAIAQLKGLDSRSQAELDGLLAELHGLSQVTVSTALVDAAANVRSLIEFKKVEAWEHVSGMCSASEEAHTLPTLLVPMLGGGGLGNMSVDLGIKRKPMMEAVSLSRKVFETLSSIVTEKGCALDSDSQLYNTPEAPAPDAKAKDPAPGYDLLGEALGMLEKAVTDSGLDLETDVCICINVHATKLCTPTEVAPPEDAEEGTPPTTAYLYSVCPNRLGEGGEPQDTPSEDMVEYYTQLAASHPALALLVDPMSNEDPQGWTKLAAAMQEQHQNRVLIGGDELYGSQVEAVGRAGLEASERDIPWACAVVSHPLQLLTTTAIAEMSQTVHKWKGSMILNQLAGDGSSCSADIAVGTRAKYVRMGLPTPVTAPKYNRYKRIEQMLATKV